MPRVKFRCSVKYGECVYRANQVFECSDADVKSLLSDGAILVGDEKPAEPVQPKEDAAEIVVDAQKKSRKRAQIQLASGIIEEAVKE
jgi:hypothetical protein